MIKIRTINPAARIASGTANHADTVRLQYIKAQSAAYGTSVFAICQTPRPSAGFSYLATTVFQGICTPGWSLDSTTVCFIILFQPLFAKNRQNVRDSHAFDTPSLAEHTPRRTQHQHSIAKHHKYFRGRLTRTPRSSNVRRHA